MFWLYIFRYVTRKEFDELKEDVRRLKKKLREFKDELKSENQKQREEKIVKEIKEEEDVKLEEDIRTPMKNCDASLYNGHSMSALTDSICHFDKLYDTVNCLLLKLFPKDYIITHSVSGKAGNSKLEKKMPFDSRLYSAFLSIVKAKFPNINTKEITEKVHSVQKKIKREKDEKSGENK